MRLLACADLHGDHEVYSWLAETARRLEPDALVLAGDLLGFPRGYQTWERAQEADARAIVGLLAPAGVAVYFVMGNHDRIMISSNSRTFVSLHERRIELGRYNLVGYAYSVRPACWSPTAQHGESSIGGRTARGSAACLWRPFSSAGRCGRTSTATATRTSDARTTASTSPVAGASER
jgi:Icc-related predicted phosphoesterase